MPECTGIHVATHTYVKASSQVSASPVPFSKEDPEPKFHHSPLPSRALGDGAEENPHTKSQNFSSAKHRGGM